MFGQCAPKLLYRLGTLPSLLGIAEGTFDEYEVNHRLALESGCNEKVLPELTKSALYLFFNFEKHLINQKRILLKKSNATANFVLANDKVHVRA